MEYGSIFGHGAYLGPDFTADYLHRAALSVLQQYGATDSDKAKADTIADFKMNRYDESAEVLTFTTAQARAFAELQNYYKDFFGEPTTRYGLRRRAISEPSRSAAGRILRLVGVGLGASSQAFLFIY